MPGLRSLVARRRCSLPPQPMITSESLICPYTVIANTISPKKRNSLDCQDSFTNCIDKRQFTNSEINWDLKSIFHNNEKTLSSCNDDISSKNIINTSIQVNDDKNSDLTINVIERESCCPDFYTADKSENNYPSPINMTESDKLTSNEFENDNSSSAERSSERIVIKMKLLHDDRLSENQSDSSEEVGISEDTNDSVFEKEIKYKNNLTRWTIDSILNEPVSKKDGELEISPISTPINNSDSSQKNEEILECDSNLNLEKELIKTDILSSDSCLNNSEKQFTKDDNLVIVQNASINNELKCNTKIEQHQPVEAQKLLLMIKNEKDDPIRFSSESSDSNIESKLEDINIDSDCSSSSSVKSCSIVIKRIDNSDTYSCFPSPKIKKKRLHENVMNNDKIIPCSIKLCNVLSKWVISDLFCPNCLQRYSLQDSVSIDTTNFKVTFECNGCDWIVVRRLIPKQICIDSKYR